MKTRSGLVLALATVTGCVGTSSGPDEHVTASAVLTANALAPSALAHAALKTDALDATSAAAMAPSADARAVLAYAIDCALDASQSVSFAVGGASYHLGGALGLAPAWTTRALTGDEAAWVSACVFSRVNLTGVSVALSARGTNAALATSASERAAYQLDEGAFWGNAFADLGHVQAFACKGADADAGVGDLAHRVCAQPSATDPTTTACGMVYAGPCADACADSAPYAGCAAPGGETWTAVIASVLEGTR